MDAFHLNPILKRRWTHLLMDVAQLEWATHGRRIAVVHRVIALFHLVGRQTFLLMAGRGCGLAMT